MSKPWILAPVCLFVLALPAVATTAPGAAHVTVNVTVTGEETGSIKASKPEDATDLIPAKSACTRFTKPNFGSKANPLAYNVSFDNPNVLQSKNGLFFAFYYNPKQVGKAQKLDHGTNTGGGTNLIVVTKPAADYTVSQPGWSGTVTLNKDLQSGSFAVTNARAIIGNAHVTIHGTWRCSVTFVRTT